MEDMNSLGFIEVYNLLGGITDWEEAGYPVVKSESPPDTTTPPTTTTPPAPLECGLQVLEIIQPMAELADTTVFSIFLVVTNPSNQTISCDIPIVINNMETAELVTTYNISATLEPGETQLVSYDEAQLSEAIYEIQAGGVTKELRVG
jgi:hypothetical protein